MGKNDREYKSFVPFITKIDQAQGVVDAIFSVFGVLDHGGDVVHPGSFAKTFSEYGNKVLVLDAHNMGSVKDVIGKPLELREVGRDQLPESVLEQFPTATGGALARIQFLMDTPEGEGAFKRIAAGAIGEWSFGYDALDSDFSTMVHDGEEVNARNLRTLKLYEISPVLWGMNPATVTTGAKDAGGGSHAGKAINLTERVEDVRAAFNAQFNPGDEWNYWVMVVYDDHVIAQHDGAQGVTEYSIPYQVTESGYVFAPMPEWQQGEFLFVPVSAGTMGKGLKIGRAISTANEKRIMGAVDTIDQAVESLRTMIQDTLGAPAPDGEAGRDKGSDTPGEAGPDQGPPTSESKDALETERQTLLSELHLLETEEMKP